MAQSVVPLQGARDRSCRTGLALRRSTAAFSILGAPLALPGVSGGFRRQDRGRRKERALGVIMRREAGPRTPGTTTGDSRGRRRRSPSTLRFARPSAPLWMGMNPTYAKGGSQSILKFLRKGVHTPQLVPVVAGAVSSESWEPGFARRYLGRHGRTCPGHDEEKEPHGGY